MTFNKMTKIEKRMKGKRKKAFSQGESFSNSFDSDVEADENMLRKGDKKWFEEYNVQSVVSNMKFEKIETLRKEAKKILDGEIALNGQRTPKTIAPSDFAWIKTVMAKGTKSDKIAAYILLIQDSPLYNLNLLNNIIGLVKVGKKEWVLAAETLQELFLGDLLPPHRKLRLFSQQPLNELDNLSSRNENKRKHLLLLWYFEDQLKQSYREFITALNHITHDSVDANKEKAISIMHKLLENSPEQESALLNNIVNKLGDPNQKVGSKVIYTLTKLLQVHPNMREVVLDEVEKLIFRVNVGKRAQYYSICFLAQFCLSNNDGKLAKKLISVYLAIFKACIKTGEIGSRMMSALLTGVNRAYPFAKEDNAILKEQIDTLYKVVHYGKPSVSIQALSLLYLMSDQTSSVSDRFYMVLYKKITEPRLFNSTHHAMFLNLILRALKNDISVDRVITFIKRLLQVSCYLAAPVICGTLYIISEVISQNKNILLLEHSAKGNQNDISHYLSDDGNDEDGYERYEDAPESDVDPTDEEEYATRIASTDGDSGPKLTNSKIIGSEAEVTVQPLKTWRNPSVLPEDKKTEATKYDPHCRNPLYAGGKKSVLLELCRLATHYHPSVSHFATTILNGQRIKYSGDPLNDFALIRFLDKFSFKNPKNHKPLGEGNETFTKFGKRKLYTKIINHLKINKPDYLQQNEKNVPDDEKFIFKYLKSKESIFQHKKDDESDIESVASDEFEEMINKMTGVSDDNDIDFMNETGQLPVKEKAINKKRESDLNEQEEEDIEDESTAEDFDGEEIDDISDEFMEGSELDESEVPPSLRHLTLKKKGKRGDADRMNKMLKENIFASAEEFSELLEENDFGAGGSQAVSNSDKAGLKQLKWEAKRNHTFSRKRKRSGSRKTGERVNNKKVKRK